MRAKDVMSAHLRTIPSTESIADAASLMAEIDVGVLPVVDDSRLVGIVTDRDIALRSFAHGLHSGSPVFEVMSRGVKCCREDDELDGVLEIMANEQVRRVPVLDADGAVAGIISISDAARSGMDEREVASTLTDICRPSALHSQVAELA
jgi:CBS domain-containing protein